MEHLTLIIPAKKEKESLPKVLEELKKFNFNIKVCLEKNDIETINSIKDSGYEIIYQPKEGYGNALIHGINICKTKYFCIFNADGSFNPKEISEMFNKLIREDLDVVFGSRYQKNSGSDDDTLVTSVGNFFFTTLGKILFSLPITDILYTFVLGKTNKVNDLKLSSNNFSFCIELPIKAHKNKLKIASISSHERSRIAGKKKVNAIKDGFLILLGMLKLLFK